MRPVSKLTKQSLDKFFRYSSKQNTSEHSSPSNHSIMATKLNFCWNYFLTFFVKVCPKKCFRQITVSLAQDLILFTLSHILPAPILDLIQVYLQHRLLLPFSPTLPPLLALIRDGHCTMSIFIHK